MSVAQALFDEGRTDTPVGRWRRMLPFLCVVIGASLLAAIPPHPNGWAEVVAAAVAFMVTTGLILWVPWHRLPTGASALVVVTFCVSVALLRDATGGAASGFAPLLCLPVIWQALFARGRDVGVAVAALAATLALPILVVGAPAYPVTQWRSTILLTLVAAGAGGVINNLVASVRAKEALLAAVAMSSRRVGLEAWQVDDELRRSVIDLTGASNAAIVNQLPDGRIAISGEPTRPEVLGDRSELLDPARRAWASGEPVFVPDMTVDDELAEAGARLGYAAMWFEPIRAGGTVTGLLVGGWAQNLDRVPKELPTTMQLLAGEAGVAFERAALVDQIQNLARSDELTGLPNRRAWDEAIAEVGATSARRGDVLSVALIDLDHFKRYNDTFGHAAGDDLLEAVGRGWRELTRPGDVLARWGGEEFALLLPGADSNEAALVVDRLRSVVPADQTFSAGVFTTQRAPLQDPDIAWMVQAADEALYAAKANGRNRTVAAGITEPSTPTAGIIWSG